MENYCHTCHRWLPLIAGLFCAACSDAWASTARARLAAGTGR
jgi:hypothetical protein